MRPAAFASIAALAATCIGAPFGWGAAELDPEFWNTYQPYQQYSPATIRDLIVLQEEDLLQSARGTDGIVVRVLGRASAASPLISARIGIDSIARLRIVAKVLVNDPTATVRQRPEIHRVQVSPAQAENFLTLLSKWAFWDATYDLPVRPTGAASMLACAQSAGWLIEGVTVDSYQIIDRSNCGGLDPGAAEIRDYLLDLAGVTAIAPAPTSRASVRLP